MSKFTTEMTINLGGNVGRRAREFEQGVSKFGTNSSRKMRLLKTSVAGVGRGLDRMGNRYTAFLGGLGLGAAAKGVISFDAKLMDVQVQAGKTAKEMAALKEKIFDTAQMPHIKLDPSQILEAFDAVIEKTGDYNLAINNLENMAVATRASGGGGREIGAIVAGLKKMGITAKEDVGDAFNLMNAQGKAGAFTMKMIATEAGPMLASMAAMGYEGIEAIRVMGAIAQTTQDSTDSAAETGTAFSSLLREITTKGKLFEDNGIKVFDQKALDEGKEKFLSLDVILKSILKETGGKMSLLTKLFGEEAQKAIKNLAAGYGKSDTMFSQMMGVTPAENQLVKDATDKATTMDAALTNLNTTIKRLSDQEFSGPIQQLSDWLGSFDKDELNSLANGIKNVALSVGGLVVASKALKGGMAISRGIKSLRSGGGVAGALGTTLGAGGNPVYVTNWPAQMGGGFGAGGKGKGKRGFQKSGFTGRFKNTGIRSRLGSKLGSVTNSGAGMLAGIGSRSSALLKGFGKRVPILGALMAAGGLISVLSDQAASAQQKLKGVGGMLGGMGGAAGGAMAGAAMGSVVPVIGTAIGGILGALAGGFGGEFLGGELLAKIGELIGVTKEIGAKPVEAKITLETLPGQSVRQTNSAEADAYRGVTQLGG